jgi:hypothetical protein
MDRQIALRLFPGIQDMNRAGTVAKIVRSYGEYFLGALVAFCAILSRILRLSWFHLFRKVPSKINLPFDNYSN